MLPLLIGVSEWALGRVLSPVAPAPQHLEICLPARLKITPTGDPQLALVDRRRQLTALHLAQGRPPDSPRTKDLLTPLTRKRLGRRARSSPPRLRSRLLPMLEARVHSLAGMEETVPRTMNRMTGVLGLGEVLPLQMVAPTDPVSRFFDRLSVSTVQY